MIRSFRVRLLALGMLAIATLAFAGHASAALPASMQSVFAATETTARSASCISATEMRQLNGTGYSRFTLFGLAHPQTREIWFDRRTVCQPIIDYKRTGRLTNWTELALATVGHEASHLRSVRSERRAECLGVRFAYRWLDRHGAFNVYDRRDVKLTLLDDSRRPAAYRLNGTCQL